MPPQIPPMSAAGPQLLRIRPRHFLAGVFMFCAATAFAQSAPGWVLLRQDVADGLIAADPGEKNNLVKASWKIDAEIRFLPVSEPGAKPLHRLARVGPQGEERMLTISGDEVAACVQNGFADEGLLGFAAATQLKPEMIPVNRYRKGPRSLWLVDPADQAWAEQNGWKLAGTSFWVLPAPQKSVAS
jgi:hypothetical protein